MEAKEPLNVYFAGELFSSKHLFGNAVLAEAIWEVSNGKYQCFLPQNLEKRYECAHDIRDEDIKSVLSADIGLFNYDGTELDSGTVVEYLFAKFADIPAVLIRTDFRKGGDHEQNPWNLMTSFFPRTKVVNIDCMVLYKHAIEQYGVCSTHKSLHERKISTSACHMMECIAQEVIAAMDLVLQEKPIMPKEIQETVYQWLAKLPGFKKGHLETASHLLQSLKRKVEKKLI